MQPNLPDPLLTELYARYMLYYVTHDHMSYPNAIAAVEQRFGVVLTYVQQNLMTAAVDTAIAATGLVDALGPGATVQDIFPGVPEGTPVELRFAVIMTDADGNEVGYNTKVVVVPAGATSIAAWLAKIKADAQSGAINTSPREGGTVNFDVQLAPSLPFESNRPLSGS